jgi:malonate-semialdehyde dehydrogenase (acetylating)/methylmalonate-semialdehyde dehydrogenase
MSQRIVRNYINGAFVTPQSAGVMDVENPSTGQIIAKLPLSGAADADRAVTAARAAFAAWSRTPVTQRSQYMFDLLVLLRKNEEKLARIITEEMGKSLPDSRAEMKRVLQNVEVACAAPMLQQGSKLLDCARDIDGEVLCVPRGVFVAITPFNFPGMAPFWFIPYALVTGNTFILKPSELTPLTAELVAEYIDAIKLPAGVFNLVNGDKAVAAALVEHAQVTGVSFVGKSSTCRIVAQKCASLNKRFQAMGSAKNHLVVMPDYTKVDDLIRNMSTSCYGCAGQRCMASSVIVAVGKPMYKTVCERFLEDSRKFIVANPLDPVVAEAPTLMGPVISDQARRFIHDMIDAGVREGATLALDGRNVKVPGCEKGHYVGPTVFTDVKPHMSIYKTEIFSPVVCILEAQSLDEAIGMINAHEFGNAASIYTQNGYYARKFKLEVNCGMIGVNVGIPAPVPFLPFGGAKESMLSDIKMQSTSGIEFFTERKVIVERFWQEK